MSGAAAEPDLAEVMAEGNRRHVAGAQRLVGVLADLDALDPSVTPAVAARTLSATSDVSFAVLLADVYGWSFEEIEAWILDTNRKLLLRSD